MVNKNLVLAVVVLIIIIAVATWYFVFRKPFAPIVSPSPATATQGLGADIYSQVAPTATTNIPQTNPYKAVQTNPFK